MNRLENMSKPLVWSTALLLTAIVAGCGGSTGAAGTPGAQGNPGIPGIPGVSGVPGTPAPSTAPGAVNLLSAASYALTTSAGATFSIGSASGVPNSAMIGGNVAMDAPTSACTSTPAVSAVGQDSCGLGTGVDITNAAFNTAGGLAITGTTIRYNPGTTPNSTAFNATVRAVKADVNTAWNDAFNRIGGALITGPGALGGRVLPPGTYASLSTMTLGSGETLTLDAGGNANAVWIFQVGTALTVTGSTVACTGTAPVVCTPTQVKLINGALAKNVFWQVGTPTTGAANGDVSFPAATGPVENNTIFKGTILAGNSVTFAGGTAVEGRVLAGANLLGTPNTQTGGAVTTTGGSTGAVTVTLPL